MKNKTIGILTFHQALNYGAVLQAYALKAVCESLGNTVYVIDYEYGGFDEKLAPVSKFVHSPNKWKALFPLVRGLMGYPWDKRREKAFHEFRKKYLSESIKCSTAEDIAALGYDVLIAGSDQIWNCDITKHRYDPVFFMDFETSAKKIVYAASSEDVPFSPEKEVSFVKELEQIQGAVSIREKKLADYVARLTAKKYPVVIDPTLLAGKSLIEKMEIPETPQETYILLYQIDTNPNSDISVKTLREKFGCTVYTMTVPRIGDFKGRKGELGPEKFLALLKGAKFVVTNSFHGIALSVIYQKQFFAYNNNGVMSRIDGLLGQLDLLNRKVELVQDILEENIIDYRIIDSRLEILRHDSMDFLVRAINDSENTRT